MDASTAPRAALGAHRSPRLLRVASDERLVALVRAGHAAAFEALYDRHHRGILAFCRHMLGQREEAEDAVQQTFLAAYNDLRRSSKAIQLRAWLYAIARNRCLSVLRARREQPAGEMVEPATEGLASEVQRREDLRELLRDMDGLPEDQRAALVLAELGAMSHDEIGEVIGVPREKVKALVFQARESLIASRNARHTDCADIRAELATLRGGALRRTHLRRHLRECAGCREFRDQLADQRRALALILPVVPTLGLKKAVLGATGGGAAGGGAGGLLALAGVKGGLLKLGAITALLGAGTTGAVVGLTALDSDGANGATTGSRSDAGRSGAGHADLGGPEHPLARLRASRAGGGTGSPGSRSHGASPSAHRGSKASRRRRAHGRRAGRPASPSAASARRSERGVRLAADRIRSRRFRSGARSRPRPARDPVPHRDLGAPPPVTPVAPPPAAPPPPAADPSRPRRSRPQVRRGHQHHARSPVRHRDRGPRRPATPVNPPPPSSPAPTAPTPSPDRGAGPRRRRCPRGKREHDRKEQKRCATVSPTRPPAAVPPPARDKRRRDRGDSGD